MSPCPSLLLLLKAHALSGKVSSHRRSPLTGFVSRKGERLLLQNVARNRAYPCQTSRLCYYRNVSTATLFMMLGDGLIQQSCLWAGPRVFKTAQMQNKGIVLQRHCVGFASVHFCPRPSLSLGLLCSRCEARMYMRRDDGSSSSA